MIVDSQVHIWSVGCPHPLHRQISSFSKDEVLKEMDAAGVGAAVIHPPLWDPNSNELAIEAARQHPDRFSVLGWIPLDCVKSRHRIASWNTRPGMLGLRFYFRPHQKTWPTDGTMDWLWPAAQEAQLPIALMAGDFLPVVGNIAMKYPGLRLIVDHLGTSSHTTDEAAFSTLPELLTLAKFPNVAVKASAAPSYSSEPYPYRNIQTYLRQIYDAFGPHRMFWGSDITRLSCPWRQVITLFTEELPWLSAHDKELIMGRALCDWIGWKIRPGEDRRAKRQ